MSQRINSFFSSNQELRQISGKVRQLRAFQSYYEQVAPPALLRSSHVAQLEDKILILVANNGAVAAKLRQLTPELIRQLELQGCEVTGIQVRVQVTLPPTVPAPQPSTLSEKGKQQLSNLAATLSDSPLKSALQRLIGNKKGNK